MFKGALISSGRVLIVFITMKVKVKVTVMSRPESWSGQSFPSGDLPNPGIEPSSPALQVDSLPAEPQGKPLIVHNYKVNVVIVEIMEIIFRKGTKSTHKHTYC